MGAGTYQQSFELPLLLHRIIDVPRVERIHNTGIVLILPPFISPRLSLCSVLLRLLRHRLLFLVNEFTQKFNHRIHQRRRATTGLLTLAQSLLPHRLAQVSEQIPERGAMHEQLEHCIGKAIILANHQSTCTQAQQRITVDLAGCRATGESSDICNLQG